MIPARASPASARVVAKDPEVRAELLDLVRCPVTSSVLVADAVERRGEEIVSGILSGEGPDYPVVEGVPVLLTGHDEAVSLVRSGKTREAAVSVLATQLPMSRLTRAAQALDLLPGTPRLGALLAHRERQRLLARLAPMVEAGAADPLAFLRLGFAGFGPPNPEAVNYFTYRFGTPRHLVALACAELVPAGEGLVLDIGCGAGHLAWGLTLRFGADQTIGVDRSLFELWAARGLSKGTAFVCGDAAALPFRSGGFRFVIASDVLSFVLDKWSVAREMSRLVAPLGTMAITSVKNALQPHVYAGMPLSPTGWSGLMGDVPHRLLADDSIVERYLVGAGLDVGDPGDVVRCPTLTLVAAPGGLEFGAPHVLPDWPHARGPLGVNPLLRPTEKGFTGLSFERRFPSVGFAADNLPLAEYLPQRISIPPEAVAGDELVREGVEHLLASTAVLALPAAYRRTSSWPPGRANGGLRP